MQHMPSNMLPKGFCHPSASDQRREIKMRANMLASVKVPTDISKSCFQVWSVLPQSTRPSQIERNAKFGFKFKTTLLGPAEKGRMPEAFYYMENIFLFCDTGQRTFTGPCRVP